MTAIKSLNEIVRQVR